MIEMYGFIAAFTAQIIFFSALGPLRVTAVLREQIARFIAEQAPPIDAEAAARVDRRLRLFGRLGLATAVIGLALLVAMIRYMLRPDWTDGPLEAVVPFYWMLQLLPTLLAAVTAHQFHAVLKKSRPPQKRSALLQPRRLFDFVPPSAVALAILVYFLYISLLLYIEQQPFPHFAGFAINAAMVTFLYAVVALSVYWTMRKMGCSPLQGLDDRMRSVGIAMRIGVYICILSVVNISLNMMLILIDEQRWEPTFQIIGLIVLGVLGRMALKEQLRIPGAEGLATSAMVRQ
jgi:hypothetical protein